MTLIKDAIKAIKDFQSDCGGIAEVVGVDFNDKSMGRGRYIEFSVMNLITKEVLDLGVIINLDGEVGVVDNYIIYNKLLYKTSKVKHMFSMNRSICRWLRDTFTEPSFDSDFKNKLIEEFKSELGNGGYNFFNVLEESMSFVDSANSNIKLSKIELMDYYCTADKYYVVHIWDEVMSEDVVLEFDKIKAKDKFDYDRFTDRGRLVSVNNEIMRIQLDIDRQNNSISRLKEIKNSLNGSGDEIEVKEIEKSTGILKYETLMENGRIYRCNSCNNTKFIMVKENVFVCSACSSSYKVKI